MKPSRPPTFRLTPAALALLSASAAVCAQEAPVKELPTVEIRAPRMITPLPGVVFDEQQTTSNVQSLTGDELQQSGAVSLTEAMNLQFQSINVNDYAGNPFQQDLNFRGFAASPLIGTPQGLSVYLDGVRINEAFGDVVNWDLIPNIAILRMDLLPGSNPMFGHNTLGGAISVNTKSGFTSPKVEFSALGGAFGRRQYQLAAGGNSGSLAGFFALNKFDEDGWRTNSPTSVRQYFGRVDIRGTSTEATLSLLKAENTLVGNGLIPEEQWRESPNSVFTSPDENINDLNHLTGRVRFDISESSSVALQMYRRDLKQKGTGGDVWDDFDQGASANRLGVSCPDGFGSPNGALDQNIGPTYPGCAGLAPNGLFNFSRSDQRSEGVALQFTQISETHQIVVGSSFDWSDVDFRQSQRLGFIDSERTVFLDPSREADLGLLALSQDITRNNLTGSSRTAALFFSDTWTAAPNLFITYGARLSYSRVKNELQSDKPIPLYQFTSNFFNSREPVCGTLSDVGARFLCSTGDYGYRSLNPSLGVSWLPAQDLNVYGNVSRGSRVPSVIELGCARDKTLEDPNGLNDGKNLGCTIPTSLTSDPFLPQVRSLTTELGFRGTSLNGQLSWSATAYRTELTDDILFVSLGQRNRGVFDTFGKTERDGFELNLKGKFGRHSLRAGYSRLNATFESSATIVNQSNSSADRTQGRVNDFEINPGDVIPGLPKHSFRLGWSMDVSSNFTFGFSMVAQSFVFARGNENNESEPGGTDLTGNAQIPGLGKRYVGKGRTSGFAVFNFNANYRVDKNISLFCKVDNIFDRRYTTAGDLAVNPFTSGSFGARDSSGFNYNSFDWTHSLFVGPGAPRAVWFGLNYAFGS